MLKKQLLIKLISILFLLVNNNTVIGEGTEEIMPQINKTTYLRVISSKEQEKKYYTYDSDPDNRLYVHINNPSETIYYGFGRATNENNPANEEELDDVYYRIIDPDGNIVKTDTVPKEGKGFIKKYSEATGGPFLLNISKPETYNALTFDPQKKGDYAIVFSNRKNEAFVNGGISFQYFDITVGKASYTEVKGRVWSKIWSLITPGFGDPTNAKVYIYTEDSIVTSMDLNGMKPFGFNIMCNSTGVTNTGNLAKDRQSVYDNPGYSQYKIFLNNPDSTAYPSARSQALIEKPIFIRGCPKEGYCINVSLNKPAASDLHIELNGEEGFQKGSRDVQLDFSLNEGKNCIPWDGRDGKGNLLKDGDTIHVEGSIISGLTNFPVVDVEDNPDGLILKNVRPFDQSEPLKVFWDDSRITTGTAIDGKVNINNGCKGSTGCHKWIDRGENNDNTETINTWWYSFSYDTSLTYVIAENCPVKTRNDTLIVTRNKPGSINLLKNDNDPDNNIDTNSIKLTGNSEFGENVSLDTTTGQFSYSTNTDKICVTDSISYAVSDTGIPVYQSKAAVFIQIKNPRPHPDSPEDTAVELCQGERINTLPIEAIEGQELKYYLHPEKDIVYNNPVIDTINGGEFDFYISQVEPIQGCESQRTKMHLTVHPSPELSFEDRGPLCMGNHLSLPSILTDNSPAETDTVIYTKDQAGTLPVSDKDSISEAGTYYAIKTTPQGCGGNASIKIDIIASPDSTLPLISNNYNPCPGETIEITLNGLSNSTYQWYVDDSLIENANSKTLNYTFEQGGKYTVKASETYQNGCKGGFTDTLINVNKKPEPERDNSLLCNESDKGLRTYKVDGMAQSTFEWQVKNGIVEEKNGNTVKINWNSPSSRALSVVEISDENCRSDTLEFDALEDINSVKINSVSVKKNNEDLAISWSLVPPDVVPGNKIRLYKRKSEGKMNWQQQDTLSPKNNVWSSGKIPVNSSKLDFKIETINRCGDTVSSNIHNNILSKVKGSNSNISVKLNWSAYKGWQNGVEKYEIYRSLNNEQNFTLIEEVGGGTLQKSWDNGKDAFKHCFRIKAHEKGGNEVASSNISCIKFDHEIDIPNVITPNGDGYNDSWVLKTLKPFGNYKVKIVNRWGKTVFESDNYQHNWSADGLSDNMYYYHIEFERDIDKRKGYIQVIR